MYTPPPLDSRVADISRMADQQRKSVSSTIRKPLEPGTTMPERRMQVAAMNMAEGNTRQLAADLKRKMAPATNSQGIVNPFSRRSSVGPLNIPKGGKTRRNKTSGGDIVTHLLTIRNQIKLYHWQTKEFARHTATDALTLALDTNIDAFVESYMGRYGRPMVKKSIKLHNFSESAAKAFVVRETKYLEKELPKKIGKGDTDLLNLRDTILGDLTKASYLFTLA
jgi:transcriptional regulator with AAA-type ATPase domain